MHRGLEVAEILYHVVSQVLPICKETAAVYDGDPQRQALDTYIALAQTCKYFYEPAMDALWENISSLEPILAGLLDPNERACSEDQRWARFLKNATRVRILQFSYYEGIVGHLHALSRHQQDEEPIFTNLRDLSCSDLRPEMARYLPVFLTSNLAHFRIARYPPVSPAVTTLSLSHLVNRCPSLQTLHCNASYESQTDRLVTRFASLVDFSTEGGLSPEVFQHCTRLTSLKVLKIGFNHAVQSIPEASDEPTFPELVSLQASIADDTDGLRLMRIVRSKTFRKLRIFFPASCSTDSVDEFLQALRTDHPDLTHITVATVAASPHDVRILGAPVSIRAFAAFKSLTSLSVGFAGISFTEDDIELLGRGCPQLSHLDMATGWMYAPLPNAVLPVRAFERFAEHVPHLAYLCADFDTRTVYDAPPPTARRAGARLALRLHHNVIDEEDALPLAAYISDIYPDAEVTTPPYLDMGVEASAMDKLWLTVQEGVPLFALVRRRELERFSSQSTA